jgi:hypothetical protein
MCLKSAVLSKFSNKSHRVQNLETDGIQEVSGSIPLISTKSSEEARKTLKSLDFKVFYFPKVDKSQYLQKVPVRLIFDGNFENQEVR